MERHAERTRPRLTAFGAGQSEVGLLSIHDVLIYGNPKYVRNSI